MCNACHNQCCGSDQFARCGCDGCDEPDCWTDDTDDDDFEVDGYYDMSPRRRAHPQFQCVEVTT